jgi:hypothetical protein
MRNEMKRVKIYEKEMEIMNEKVIKRKIEYFKNNHFKYGHFEYLSNGYILGYSKRECIANIFKMRNEEI